MNHAVFWSDAASNSLIAVLLRANDKPGYWAIVREIDRRLAANPLAEGESRHGDYRLLYVRPFAVLFRVDGDPREVHIEELQWVGA